MRRAFYVVLLGLFAFLAMGTAPAQAQLSEVQPFNFGNWIVADNNGTRDITVQADGNYTHSPQLIMLSPPQPGIYRLDGLAPFADILSVDVTMNQPMSSGGPEIFIMDNFDVLAPDADGFGTAFITIGARARTSASGTGYAEGSYSGSLDLVINL